MNTYELKIVFERKIWNSILQDQKSTKIYINCKKSEIENHIFDICKNGFFQTKDDKKVFISGKIIECIEISAIERSQDI